jgi:hypothetical protein
MLDGEIASLRLILSARPKGVQSKDAMTARGNAKAGHRWPAFAEMVEPGGFEPPTSAMPLRRSPN